MGKFLYVVGKDGKVEQRMVTPAAPTAIRWPCSPASTRETSSSPATSRRSGPAFQWNPWWSKWHRGNSRRPSYLPLQRVDGFGEEGGH